MLKLYMLTTILSLLFFFSLQNELLFSKFHQSDYKVKDIRMELEGFNHEVFEYYTLRTFKYNRSTAAVNMTFKMKKNKDAKKAEVVVQVYKFASNEYRVFPIRFQVNVYKAIKANIVGLGEMFACGNMSAEPFYFTKGKVYHMCNMLINARRLPPLIPFGRYKVETRPLYENDDLVTINAFGEVYRDL